MGRTYGGPTYSFSVSLPNDAVRQFFDRGFEACLEHIRQGIMTASHKDFDFIGAMHEWWSNVPGFLGYTFYVKATAEGEYHWIQVCKTTWRIFR